MPKSLAKELKAVPGTSAGTRHGSGHTLAHVDPTPARPSLGLVPGQPCSHQVSHVLGPEDTRPQPRSLVPLSLPGRRVLNGGLGTLQLWATPHRDGPHSSPACCPGLAVGLDPQGYGNPDFCWLSLRDTLIWSFAGPIGTVIVVSGQKP